MLDIALGTIVGNKIFSFQKAVLSSLCLIFQHSNQEHILNRILYKTECKIYFFNKATISGAELVDSVLDVVRKEAESCDCLQVRKSG